MTKGLALFVLACTATTFARQTASGVPKALVLTGCIDKTDTTNQLRLADRQNGTYRLSGTDLRRYLGKRVQVTGFQVGGLDIVGGLLPSPTVAGQAGAIDPARAAVAAMPGGAAHGTGPEPVLEFQVKKVRTLQGVCP
jgi:hypothetical protein